MIEPSPSLPVVLTQSQAALSDMHKGVQRRAALQAIMRQLSKSLTVLASAADMIVQGRTDGIASQSFLFWLQPNARQAEDALHRLREYRLTGSPAATELIQCLTVLVLAADMIVQGQLRGDASLETYDLLHRNADRAIKSLEELKKEVLW
ncbi:hypothetical protein [Roseiflexus castenholzii]|uniref:Uncharacterized protein n=1 Tax=Roseiflexus castenholzii (strain DSM 13941 / HLO8) TaxID=383372 RepID=A7NHM0_ROSCS|nr:hypothetical protein [Roseiflexus castenholzii]ABU56967.1 conserved hypothetical protein [Roseiflexus castenholzii DSM 13941]